MKNVLITGASHGIGKAIAIKFAQAGYNVIINYNKSQTQAENLAKSLIAQGFSCICIKANVSISSDVEKMFEYINNNFGGVDILINNAGIAHFGLLTDLSENEWDNIFAVNVKSSFLCAKAATPNMVSKKWGKIINVSSIWGISGASCEVCYSASKAALIGFTKALALELAPSNINVNCIAPGVIDTKMNSNLSDEDKLSLKNEIPLGRFGSPEEIAESVLFLASDASSFITGQTLSSNGGMIT